MTSETGSLSAFRMHPAMRLGAVHLKVSDMARALSFYRDMLGFQVLASHAGEARLAAADEIPLLVLREVPGAQPRPLRSTGLYHVAICLPTRLDLARLLGYMVTRDFPLAGASDHGVSEALYLTDLDENGLEIYCDRPRAEWPRANGKLGMITAPLDAEGMLEELSASPREWDQMPAGTTVGHIHLQVADLRAAEGFYAGTLGLELMQRYGAQAAFLSAGGYHHHVGINTWAGAGAPPAPDNAVGLDHFTVVVSGADELARMRAHWQATGQPVSERDGALWLADPSGNRVSVISD